MFYIKAFIIKLKSLKIRSGTESFRENFYKINKNDNKAITIFYIQAVDVKAIFMYEPTNTV